MLKINQKGFTLIELLLVVVIIGLMLAVIVPRAWRANIDAKYGLVRQNCSELASFGQEWAENQILAQEPSTSTAVIDDYLASLADPTAALNAVGFDWVADQATSNWSTPGLNIAASALVAIPGRVIQGVAPVAAGVVPEVAVEGIMPPEKVILNPFNEANVFRSPNNPVSTGNAIVGAIGCGSIQEGALPDAWHYYAFIFQGTDNTTIAEAAANGTTFYAGQALTAQGLRNGVFFARVRP